MSNSFVPLGKRGIHPLKTWVDEFSSGYVKQSY